MYVQVNVVRIEKKEQQRTLLRGGPQGTGISIQ